MSKVYKIVMLGDRKVGKTSYIKKLLSGEFVKEYKETNEVKMYEMYIDEILNYKELNVKFNIWDCIGDENIMKRKDYLYGADGAIIMFDLTNKESYDNVEKWKELFKSICPNSPILVVANKADNKKIIKVPSDFSISVKFCYNFDKPIIHLYEKLENIDHRIGRKDLEPKSKMFLAVKKYFNLDEDENNYEDYSYFLQRTIIETSKPKQVTNYKLISSEYDAIISNETTEKCEKIVKDNIDITDKIDELTDEEIIILITLKYIGEFNKEYNDDSEKVLLNKLYQRLLKVYRNSNYYYFIKLFILATNYEYCFK